MRRFVRLAGAMRRGNVSRLGCLAQRLSLVVDHSNLTGTPLLLREDLRVGDCFPHILGHCKLPAIYCGWFRNRNNYRFGGRLNLGYGLIHGLAARRIDIGISFAAALDNSGNDVMRSCFRRFSRSV